MNTLRRLANAVLVLALGAVLVLGLGYWHASRHAHLYIQVNDYGLRTDRQAYGSPHDVALVFRDASERLLAQARSVEPQGYILAVHPDGSVGNCQHRSRQPDYSACYKLYSAWSAAWAPLVRRVDVTVGNCALRSVPVNVHYSNNEWLLWWVPLPHMGGWPYQSFAFSVAVDGRTCRPMTHPA